jgi:DNA (cytosine-5)-methyltransferase 1
MNLVAQNIISEMSTEIETNRQIRAFDLFCGAGGSSFGAHSAGVIIVGGVERWALAADTYEDNFNGAVVYRKDIRKLHPEDISKAHGRIDLLLASPECTNHTVAKGKGRKTRKAEISRETAFEVVRFAAALKPRWVVVENVIQMKQWRRYQEWLTKMCAFGYKHSEQVLNAADFGVRQTRKRLFILFSKESQPQVILPSVKSRRAIEPALNLNGKYAYSLLKTKARAKPTLERAERAKSELGPKQSFLLVYYGSDGAGGWQRLSSPLRTITTVDRFALVKWDNGRYRMRMLQVPELRHAMGFPDSFRFENGTRRDKIAMLGNGVCPPVMEHIVKTLTSKV